MSKIGFVRETDAPLLPPPPNSAGVHGWLRRNLFSSFGNSVLTIVLAALLALIAWQIIGWALIRAVWVGVDREACAVAGAGACWPFVWAKFPQWLFGFYPIEERWRPVLTFLIGAAALVPMLMPSAPGKFWNALFLIVIYPLLALALLRGGVFGLVPVETADWGGLLVTLVVSITGIAASLPLGIALALGRQSRMPVVRSLSIAFIELWRGVPLITVLFMASVMLPLFFPAGTVLDKLLRVLIGISLFSAAYMAEAVRGGLQAIPKGQYEGAMALGLGWWPTMRLIILPQALRISIPNIVGNFIGLFKDTTLVLIVGIYDFLGIISTSTQDAKWAAPETANTGYFVAAIVFWAFCFGMSRYAMFTERRLDAGHRR